MILTRVSAPAALISLEDAKAHMRVDAPDDDTYITGLITAVEAFLDGPRGVIGRPIKTQRWSVADRRPSGRVNLPVFPVTSLVTLTYFDTDNASQSLSVSDSSVFSAEAWAYLEPNTGVSWPQMYDRPDALTITVDCGAATPDEDIILAAKMLVSHWHERREAVDMDKLAVVPMAAQACIDRSRHGWIGS